MQLFTKNQKQKMELIKTETEIWDHYRLIVKWINTPWGDHPKQLTQPVITCSKLTIETLKQGVKYFIFTPCSRVYIMHMSNNFQRDEDYYLRKIF